VSKPSVRILSSCSTVLLVGAVLLGIDSGYVLFFEPFHRSSYLAAGITEGISVLAVATMLVYRRFYWPKD
jgi:hypothetical protein